MNTMSRLAYPAPIESAVVLAFPRPRLSYPAPIKNYEVAQHPTTPLGDHRERAATCASCRRETWNVCGRCSSHCDHSPSTSAPTS